MSENPFGVCFEENCEDTPIQKMPSTIQMAKNLFSTMKDVIGGAYEGKGLTVTEEQFQERAATCTACPFLEQESFRCTKCGCFMKAKIAFKQSYCPENKWGKIDD